MRRKIEKYLAKQQGCNERHVRTTRDGRYDLMDDLEGVLAAVRGKGDSSGRSRGGGKGPGRQDSSQSPVLQFLSNMAHMYISSGGS